MDKTIDSLHELSVIDGVTAETFKAIDAYLVEDE
jgi:hypothetical protein